MTAAEDALLASRREATVYLDSDVLTATKVVAAARERSESQVVEDARADLRSLMDRLARGADPDDDAAMILALEEVAAVRGAQPAAPAA